MSFLFALLLALGSPQTSDQLREMVRRAQVNFQRNNELAEHYTYKERQMRRHVDAQGRATRTEIVTYDVIYIAGTPWKRLVARNDLALSADEQRREQQRVDEEIRKRQKETAEQRARRLREFQKKKQEREDAARQVLDAFDFQQTGQETVAGLPCLILSATPRAGYQGHGRIGNVLRHLSGRLWITAATDELLKFQADVLDDVSFGWFLAKLNKGGQVIMAQTRINSEVWLPSEFSLKLSYRAIFKKVNIEQENTYFDYRKFTAESKVTPVP